MKDYPPISIIITTYNHERFIAECLESILMQEYPGVLKILIGDDCSTDKTPDIVKFYAQKNPSKIIPICRDKNIGMHNNFLDLINRCDTEWIATCEGDDFWSNPLKLTSQIEALVKHPNCVICFGQIQVSDLYNVRPNVSNAVWPCLKEGIYTRMDLLKGEFIHTATAVFKKTAFKAPDWYLRWPIGDYTFQLEILKNGDAFFIKDVLSVYRVHNQGIWSGLNEYKRIKILKELCLFLVSIESSVLGRKNLYSHLTKQQFKLIFYEFKMKRFTKTFTELFTMITYIPKGNWDKKRMPVIFLEAFKKGIKLIRE